MKHIREMRVILGSLIWLGLVGFLVIAFRSASAKAPGGFERLIQYACNQNLDVRIVFVQPQLIAVGDLVFLADQSTYTPVGFVSRVGDIDSTTKDIIFTNQATVTFYGNAPTLSTNDFLTYHMPGNDTAWVIDTMFPSSKRAEISKLFLEAYVRDSEIIVAAMRPVIAKSLSEATAIIKEDLQAAFIRREDQLRQIGQKYQHEIIEDQLVPLFREEFWPIMQTEGEPLATKIGQEIWREMSLFRFAWRYAYDRSVGPDVSLTHRELTRFLETKAVPIINAHVDEMLEVQNRVVARVAKNERVQETIVDAVKRVSSDPEIQHIVSEIFQEVLINNQRLRDSLQKNWKSPDALAAIELTSARLEPTINDIGITLFGSTDDKITPEFARVLRHRILHKDSRWLTLHVRPATETQHPTRPARAEKLIVHLADPTGKIPYAPARER